MPLGAWRFKSSHPHSDEGRCPCCRGGVRGHVVFRRRPGSKTHARGHDRGRCDPEGTRPGDVRTVAPLCLAHGVSGPDRGGADAADPPCPADDSERRDSLALPPRRGRLRSRGAAFGRRAAEPGPGSREGLAEPALPRARRHRYRGLGRDRRQRSLGREPRDLRPRDEDRHHRRRPRCGPPVLQSGRFPVPTRVSEGPAQVHDAQGDRAADVCTRAPRVEVRERAVRPRELVSRDPCRRHRSGRQQHERSGEL